jgi:hypothetical protein
MKRTILPVLAILLAGAAGGCDGAERRLTSPDGSGPRLTVGPTASVTLACPTKMDRGTSGSCVAFGYDANGYLASQSASWSSSNSSLVSVSGGAVTASSSTSGTATITATINSISKTASIIVANSNATSPPSVTINGPSSIKPNVDCWWWADVTSGTAPFTYSWSQSPGTGGGYLSDYTGRSSSSFTIYLTVTDSNGLTGSATKSVTVTSGAGICPV